MTIPRMAGVALATVLLIGGLIAPALASPPEHSNAGGNSDKAAGTNEDPGNSGDAPGNSGDTPGNSGDASEQGNDNDGKPENPGNSGDAPGNDGDVSEQGNDNDGDAPGNSGDASDQGNDNNGKPDNPGNSSQTPAGNGDDDTEVAAQVVENQEATFAWNGVNGAENLPCDGTLHWIFTAGGTAEVSSATINVDGATDTGVQSGQGAWHFYTPGVVTIGSAVVTYTGSLGQGNTVLTISGCEVDDNGTDIEEENGNGEDNGTNGDDDNGTNGDDDNGTNGDDDNGTNGDDDNGTNGTEEDTEVTITEDTEVAAQVLEADEVTITEDTEVAAQVLETDETADVAVLGTQLARTGVTTPILLLLGLIATGTGTALARFRRRSTPE